MRKRAYDRVKRKIDKINKIYRIFDKVDRIERIYDAYEQAEEEDEQAERAERAQRNAERAKRAERAELEAKYAYWAKKARQAELDNKRAALEAARARTAELQAKYAYRAKKARQEAEKLAIERAEQAKQAKRVALWVEQTTAHNMHIKTVHEGLKECKCEYSYKEYNRKENLNRHVKIKHFEEEAEEAKKSSEIAKIKKEIKFEPED